MILLCPNVIFDAHPSLGMKNNWKLIKNGFDGPQENFSILDAD